MNPKPTLINPNRGLKNTKQRLRYAKLAILKNPSRLQKAGRV